MVWCDIAPILYQISADNCTRAIINIHVINLAQNLIINYIIIIIIKSDFLYSKMIDGSNLISIDN